MMKITHGEIWSEDFGELDKLIRDFQSCVRFSCCRFAKDKIEFNDVRKAAKVKYPILNTRQLSDAVKSLLATSGIVAKNYEAKSSC